MAFVVNHLQPVRHKHCLEIQNLDVFLANLFSKSLQIFIDNKSTKRDFLTSNLSEHGFGLVLSNINANIWTQKKTQL